MTWRIVLTMRRLGRDFIIKQYTKEDTKGRFPAAGLFVDISGFSTITGVLMVHGQHGAKVMATLMGHVFERLPVPRPMELRPVAPDVVAHFYPNALATESYSGEFRGRPAPEPVSA